MSNVRQALALVVVVGIAALALWRLDAFTAWLLRDRRAGTEAEARGAGGARAATGEELFDAFCAACHGTTGRGDGPAAAYCRIPPSDLTRAEFKVRSTPTGALPSDADLAAVIRRGAGGEGAMPAFRGLDDAAIERLVARIKTFSPRWQHEQVPPDVALPARVDGDPRRGEALYLAWGCAACHGPKGEGDGPRARELRNSRGLPDPPTDLTRPWTFKAPADEAGLVRALVTGFNGTTMPAYAAQAGSGGSLWDLAAFMRSVQRPPPAPSTENVDTAEARGYWRTPIPEQAGDLSAASCAACHPSQFADWTGARHAGAMGPGVWAQMNDDPELSGMCATCHAPLRNQWNDAYLSADGVSCSGCHLRDGRAFGPPPKDTTIAPLVARYEAPHGPVQTRDFFERVDFCDGCHQFADGRAPKANGAFLQNTVNEWKASRAAREGKTCQSCHMPERRHLFRGIHDPQTTRGGVAWTFSARLEGSRLVSRLTLTNTNTGHAFPTYVVPEVWMRIEAVDRFNTSRVIAERLIARRVVFDNGEWRELGDTRLDQDETAILDYAGALPPGTIVVAGTVVVRPDAYHVTSLARHMRETTSAASRRSYEQALAEMRASEYVLFREERAVGR
ncbi:MAG: c-type cytochrome [Acidobacteriota bacterium]